MADNTKGKVDQPTTEKEPLKMSLTEAWRMYQNLKSTFSVSNKNTVTDIFTKEFNLKMYNRVIQGENLVCFIDNEFYTTTLESKLPEEEKAKTLLDSSVVMTENEWVWRPVEDGLMPFLFEILAAINQRRRPQ